jgi:hypothetical protein
MSVVRALIVLCIAGSSFAYWKHHHASPRSAETQSVDSQGGFVSLPPADGQRPQTVFVVAAENCPHEAAQRADRLAKDLSAKGIPVERTHQVHFHFTSKPDSATMDRMNKIMTGPLPAVFINGRAKSNPSLEEVASEFSGAAQ